MNKNQDKFRITLFVLLGLILGGILGEFLGWTLGTLGELTGAGADNTVRSVFTTPFFEQSVGYNNPEGVAIDLYLIKFKFGFGFRFNIISVVGLWLSLYLEKWSRGR